MENEKQQLKNVNQINKSVYFTFLDWIVLISAVLLVCVVIITSVGLTTVFLDKIYNFAQLALVLFWAVISILTLKLKLKKFKKTKTEKAYKVLVMVIWIVTILTLISAFF